LLSGESVITTLARVQRILSFLLLWFLPVAALADGMVIPTVAYPAKVTIPDQRALICFSNGTERLVIETRFTGAGTNFAWVVPLPSPPVIEQATTGLFPTLHYIFRPEIVHEVPPYFIGILALIWLGYVLFFVRPTGRINGLDLAASLLLIVAICVNAVAGTNLTDFDWADFAVFGVGMLIIYLDQMCIVLLVRFWRRFGVFTKFLLIFILAFQVSAIIAGMSAGARSRSMGAATSTATVSILDRKLIGIFETTTITSRDPKALENWLRENGFAVSTNAEPVIASYVKDGWVFVATKIRRDDAKPDTSTPHPLSFTFKTDKPVYPMRLTGLNSQSLSVELYVFGPARAEAPHFKVERCTRPNYPEPPPNDFWSWNWRSSSPETPDIVHPLLRKWVIGSPVATKLVGRLSPADMQTDVWLDQAPFFFEQKNRLFSQQGALTIALNWGTEFFAAGLVVVCLLAFTKKKYKLKLPRLFGNVFLSSLCLVGLIYLCLPKIEVRTVKVPRGMEQVSLFQLGEYLSDSNPATRAEISAKVQHLLANPTNDVEWSHFAGRMQSMDNYLLGGRIREEDSPGNFTLRENDGQLEIVAYDAQGAEHILPGELSLPLKR
jgi:hypothetical protein